MRKLLIAAILMSSATVPAFAQVDDRRVDRLEREVRALQRQVFPGGNGEFFEPDIRPGQQPTTNNAASSAPIIDLTERVNALEAQLQSLTGQIEQNSFQLRELQSQVAALQENGASVTPEGPASVGEQADVPTASEITVDDNTDTSTDTASNAAAATDDTAATDDNAEEPLPSDPAEAAYIRGYRQWRDGNYEQARTLLSQAVDNHPGHRFESYARNLLGRAYLDDGKPANATEIFVRNYQEIPNGERAADSLYFLGVALTELNYNERACLAFAELQEVYGDNLRGTIAQQVPAARAAASCN